MDVTAPASPSKPVAAAIVILAIVAVLSAMREAQTIVIPTLIAIFVAVVADSPVAWLERKGLHRMLGIILVLASIVFVLAAFGVLAGSSLQELSERAPAYQRSLQKWIDQRIGLDSASPIPVDTSQIFGALSPDAAWNLVTILLNAVSAVFRRAFLVLFLVGFILFEIPHLGAKLEVVGSSSATWRSIAESVRRYLAIKSLTSLATGILIGSFLALLDLDFAIIWGLLAFLLNYIPNIGSLIASIPAILLALLQLGPAGALLVAAGYLVINLTIGNLIEPRVMGRGLGLSTLVVFLSLVLWGWLLGPIGMLISVPLTATVKIALQEHPSTRPIAVLLGSSHAIPPPPEDPGRQDEPALNESARAS